MVVGTTAYLSSTSGIRTSLILGIYEGFDEDDNWIWGTLGNDDLAGKCDGTMQGVSDGSNEIQRRLNNPVLQSGQQIYFYYDLEWEETMGYYWTNNGEYLLYCGNDINDCLYYYMLEYYLINSHNIINTYEASGGLRPANKDFIYVEISDDIIVGNYVDYYHHYKIYYGIPSYVPGTE